MTTIAAVSEIFRIVQHGMKKSQLVESHIAHYLPIMYGVVVGLEALLKDNRFVDRTGQYLFLKSTISAVNSRILDN
jgi:hypothetical protein